MLSKCCNAEVDHHVCDQGHYRSSWCSKCGGKIEPEPTVVKQFYVQRHGRGSSDGQPSYVGNSMLWWKHDDNGYVCDIREARVWSDEDSARLIEEDRGFKYARWPKELIDGIVQHHIDIQDARRLNVPGTEKL